MTAAKVTSPVNINSLLISIVILLSTWTLKTVRDLETQQAVILYRIQALERKTGISMERPQSAISAIRPILGQLDSSSPSR